MWSKEPPAEPGWYWWRKNEHDQNHQAVFVERDYANTERPKTKPPMPLSMGELLARRDGEWQGPIAPQEERYAERWHACSNCGNRDTVTERCPTCGREPIAPQEGRSRP
jgi:hypothetical protein